MKVLKDMLEKLSKMGEPVWDPITVDACGFSTGTRRIECQDISSIAAFKRDMLTLDDIWFQLDTEQGHVLVCEEQPGFKDWEAAVCEQFPAVAGWQQQVVLPPFAENFTVLYSRT